MPSDPNEIIGPKGFDSTTKWVSIKDNLPYKILFENDPEFATAPAQKVIIYMPIHPKLNPNSLRLEDFGFGSLTFTVPPNTTAYTQRLDIRDSLGVFLDVTAGLDMINRRAFWIFQSIDPATGLSNTLPADAGFLPVNDSSRGNGEGYVTLTLQPVANAQTRDSISATADIIFDINEAIATNVERNTIDAVAPVSKVNGAAVSKDTVNLHWSGKDDANGSGIKEYNLYYSEDSSLFILYRQHITDTVAKFAGAIGKTYSFYTIASDNTGNAESPKNKGELTVTLKAQQANQPPVISMVTPPDTQTFLKGGTVHLEAAAHDSDGTVSKVEFYNGAALLATILHAPYKFSWKPDRLGNYTLTARATDNDGAVTASTAITISVVPNQPPAVTIIKPGAGESFTAPATINFEITAQDSDGRIVQVRLYEGSNLLLLANEYKLPYTYQWKNVPAGVYAITAIARDNWGDETTSAPLTITVASPAIPVATSRPSITTGKKIKDIVSLKLVPNPARNIVNLYTTGLPKNKQLTVSIISPVGTVVRMLRSTTTNQLIKLNVSSLVNGIYTIRVLTGDKALYKQFVKL